MIESQADGALTHGYWLVAFVDLLGQQDAFLKTDYLPNGDDTEKKAAFIEAVQSSVGAIRRLRQMLDGFRGGLAGADDGPGSPLHGLAPDVIARIKAMQTRRVREDRWSDGVMLSCPLKPIPQSGHAAPILGVYDILCTCSALMLVQLAMGRPIRGGLDVGTGMEVDNELFGAALVKAYRLESHAEQPRLVVGDGLLNYLRASANAPGLEVEREFERRMATNLLKLLVPDEDSKWIVDYAGPQAKEFVLGNLAARAVPVFPEARAFAHRSRATFQREGAPGQKLFERYSKVVRYLDARAALWGDAHP